MRIRRRCLGDKFCLLFTSSSITKHWPCELNIKNASNKPARTEHRSKSIYKIMQKNLDTCRPRSSFSEALIVLFAYWWAFPNVHARLARLNKPTVDCYKPHQQIVWNERTQQARAYIGVRHVGMGSMLAPSNAKRHRRTHQRGKRKSAGSAALLSADQMRAKAPACLNAWKKTEFRKHADFEISFHHLNFYLLSRCSIGSIFVPLFHLGLLPMENLLEL